MWNVYTQMAHVSQAALQDILRRTLLQVARLFPHKVIPSLLRQSPHCDRYVTRQQWGQLRTSTACPGTRGGCSGGPTDSVFCLCRTAKAMWNMLASEPCLVKDVLKILLMVQQNVIWQKTFAQTCSCCRFLAVSVWMRPAAPYPGLCAPLQPLLPSPRP